MCPCQAVRIPACVLTAVDRRDRLPAAEGDPDAADPALRPDPRWASFRWHAGTQLHRPELVSTEHHNQLAAWIFYGIFYA